MDTSLRGLVAQDAVRVVVVDATEVSQQTAEIHDLGFGAARLGAEIGVAALLMGGQIKGEERITLQLQTERPPASAFAEVDSIGTIRARVQPASLPLRTQYTGVMLAIKSNAERELYRGATELRLQSLTGALTGHLVESAQVQGSVVIDVQMGAGGVERAVGMLIERLPIDVGRPSMTPEDFTERFSDLTAQDVTDALAGSIRGDTIRRLDEWPLMWMCRCSQEKVEGMMSSVGTEALVEMRDQDHGAEVICHFCNTAYKLDQADLSRLIVAIEGPVDA